MGDPIPSSRPSTEVIGRAAELAAAARLLDDCVAGPSALLLEGEPGIGKTTLLRWIQREGRDRSYRVLTCHPSEAERRLSYVGLGDLFDRVDQNVLDSLVDPQRRAIDLALLRSEDEAGIVDQRAVSAASFSVLRSLASDSPLIVAVDDVQWLDRPSARVLEFAFRRIEDEHIGFVLATRSPVRGRDASTLLRAIPSQKLVRISLGPLSEEELDALFRVHLGIGLRRPVLSRLHRTSGGNPFFALELARHLIRRGPHPDVEEHLLLPETLRELVRDRLAALPAAAGELLAVASMVSEPTVSIIRATLETEVNAALEAALDARVMELDGEQIRFTHPLLASAAYSELSPMQRRRLHRRLANVVPDPESRARHLALATIGADPTVAAALDDAARAAYGRGAPSSAAELAELARTFTPSDRLEDVWRRSIDAAHYHFQAGEVGRGRTLLDGAEHSCPAGLLRGEALMLLGDWSEDPAEARRLLEGALEEGRGDPALTVKIRRYLVSKCMWRGEIKPAGRHAAAGLRVAARLGDEGELGAALINSAETRLFLGEGLRQDLVERALSLGIDSRQALTAAWMHSATGDFDGARRRLREVIRQAEERGEDNLRPAAILELSDLEYRAGEWDEALALAEHGLSLLLKLEWGPMHAWGLSYRAQVLAGRGQLDEARREALESLELLAQGQLDVDLVVHALPVLGFIELSAGNVTVAHQYLGPLPQRCSTMGIREPHYLRFVPDEVEALVARGEVARATTILEPFEERSRALDRAYGLAVAARCRGLILAAEGRIDAALTMLEGAVRHHDRVQEPFELGRTLLVRGEVRRRTKHWRPARESLQSALGIFERLGAALWADRARAELARVGGRAPGPTSLTPTERRVADLVAVGKTNQEVANALFMSRRTVEANLSRIYAKLGVRSRTELAALLHDDNPRSAR